MRCKRKVQVCLFCNGTIAYRCAGTATSTGDTCPTIPAYIAIRHIARHGSAYPQWDISKEHIVGTLIIIVVTIYANAGAQRLYLGKIDDPLKAVAVYVAAVYISVVYGVSITLCIGKFLRLNSTCGVAHCYYAGLLIYHESAVSHSYSRSIQSRWRCIPISHR